MFGLNIGSRCKTIHCHSGSLTCKTLDEYLQFSPSASWSSVLIIRQVNRVQDPPPAMNIYTNVKRKKKKKKNCICSNITQTLAVFKNNGVAQSQKP